MHPALFLKLSEALKNNDSQDYSDIFEVNLVSSESLTSEFNYNIFHEIANSKLNEKYLIPFLEKTVQVIKSRLSTNTLLIMLNSQVNLEDKFSPLHVSILRAKAVSFRQGLSKKMVEYGADPGVKTGKGRNCLHLCAETGLMGLFLFIRDEYGLDLDEKDFKGFSPLYLAISERREDMALLILSLSKGLKVDVKLAMQAAVQTGNYKITRNLLLHRREESLDVKNLEKSDDKAINKLLVILTKNNPKADQKSLKFFFLLIFGLLTKYSSTVYFILFKDQDYFEMISFSINSAKLVSLFITLVLVLVLNQIDPGTEVRNEKVTLMDLYLKYIPEYVCPYCALKKHKGTKHCYTCLKCVREYDHHCKWINNCIGKNNLKLFIALLVSILCNVLVDVLFYCFFSVFERRINWSELVQRPSFGLFYLYLEVYAVFVDVVLVMVVLPVAFKLCKRSKDFKKVNKQVPKEPLLANVDHLKGFRDLENEATSDTASMFIKATLDSNSESASSSTFLSQFFSNRSQ